MDTQISIFGGSGFIGSWYHKLRGGHLHQREETTPKTNQILTFVSTIDNYNVWSAPTLDINTNQIWLMNLLESSRKKFDTDFTINYVSTWFVYGKEGVNPVNEEVVCRPMGFYSITKYAAELMLESYCNSYGIPYRILRLANVIGAGNKKLSPKKGAFQFMIESLSRGQEVNLYKDDHVRDFIDVRDCVAIIDRLVHQSRTGQIYNVGNGSPVSINTWVRAIHSAYGGKINLIDVPVFHNTVQRRHFWMDITKAKNELGSWGNPTPMEETVRWIIENAENQN